MKTLDVGSEFGSFLGSLNTKNTKIIQSRATTIFKSVQLGRGSTCFIHYLVSCFCHSKSLFDCSRVLMEFDLISDLSIVSKSLDTACVVLFNVIWSTSCLDGWRENTN